MVFREDARGKDSTVSQQVKVEPKVKDEEAPALEDAEVLDEVEENKKRHLNVVFIGHVDAGKSTIAGQVLFLSGQVDDCTIQKYEKEAKDKSRESWYMAYMMDTNEEERIKGIALDVGSACFENENTRFTILDAPADKSYVPNMISGAAQADIGVLVISAHKGEFKTGYERDGQTREHVELPQTLGVSTLFVVVNKMEDPTVNSSKERCPVLTNIWSSWFQHETRLDKSICPSWNGPCLFKVLDAVEILPQDPKGPFRMPIIDKFKDMGTVIMGKVESGAMRECDSLLVMPNKAQVKVLAIYCDEDKATRAGPHENLRVKLSRIEEENILSGFVLCSVGKCS